MSLPERRRSTTIDRLDNAVLVVAVQVAANLALKLLGWVVGTVFFFIKLLVVAAVLYGAVRLATAHNRRR